MNGGICGTDTSVTQLVSAGSRLFSQFKRLKASRLDKSTIGQNPKLKQHANT